MRTGPAARAGLRPARVAFRVIHAEDAAFLLRLYAATREWEFRLALWPEAEKQEFLQSQFRLQDLHVQRAYPDAVRRIVTLDGADIGRLYVDRQDACLRIVEFSLLPEVRGRGIGTDILRSLLNEAHGGKVPVRLFVERESPALRLYLRHGFVVTGRSGHHLALEWRPDVGPREV